MVLWNRSGLSGKTNLTAVWKGPDGRAIPRNNQMSVTTAAIATFEGDEPAAVVAQSLPPLDSFTHVPSAGVGGSTILQWGASSTAVGIQGSTTYVQLPRPTPPPMSAGPGLIECVARNAQADVDSDSKQNDSSQGLTRDQLIGIVAGAAVLLLLLLGCLIWCCCRRRRRSSTPPSGPPRSSLPMHERTPTVSDTSSRKVDPYATYLAPPATDYTPVLAASMASMAAIAASRPPPPMQRPPPRSSARPSGARSRPKQSVYARLAHSESIYEPAESRKEREKAEKLATWAATALRTADAPVTAEVADERRRRDERRAKADTLEREELDEYDLAPLRDPRDYDRRTQRPRTSGRRAQPRARDDDDVQSTWQAGSHYSESAYG